MLGALIELLKKKKDIEGRTSKCQMSQNIDKIAKKKEKTPPR